MRKIFFTIGALLFAAAILLAGNGLQTTVLALRANIEGFSLTIIGLLLSFYYIGFVLGCRFAPIFIQQVGHVRAFTAFASVASAIALLHVLIVTPVFWLLLRGVTGFCFAALHMVIESWINEKASNQNRGKILAVYRVVDYGAIVCGQMMITIGDPAGFMLFAVTSILVSLALVPVALSTAASPGPVTTAKLNIPKLWLVSPLSAVGVFCAGAANSAFWGMGPVFVRRLGYDLHVVGLFMSVAIMGAAVSQVPIGFLSDKIDRRTILIFCTSGAVLAGICLSIFGPMSVTALLIACFFYGLTAMPVYGVSVAYANDFAQPGEYVQVSGGLLLLFGFGAMAGPVIGPLVMQITQPSALFFYTAAVNGALAIFGIYRMTVRKAAPPSEEASSVIPSPRTSPVAFTLDPRAGELSEDAVTPRPSQ